MIEEDSSGNIRVICRFRPINERERLLCAESQCVEFPLDKKTVIINPQADQGGPHNFVFDHVFTPNAKQCEVYEIAARPTIEAVMQGFNGTVFAYGQTSSGKTFTMTGPDLSDNDLMGIIPRMISTVFNQIEHSDSKIEFQVKVGYCEIYLEKIKDLLDPSKTNLKVHEDRTRGVYISDLTEEYVSSRQEVYDLIKTGTGNREVGYTHMNAGSSRSHSIFILTITQTNSTDYSSKTGKLYLVDLAGSEKVGKTGAAGKRLEEAKNINKSLTTLGSVITALTDGKSSHVPYRDSKLTRVLQDSLGGNSKTSLIITCSPSPDNESETISTLRFGVRAKSIKNKAKVNREYTVNELKLMLAQAKEEIAEKDKIIATIKKNFYNNGVVIEESLANTLDEGDTDNFESENTKKNEIYNEIIMDLEETRGKLDEEIKNNRKLKYQIEILTLENEQMKNDHSFINKQIEDLHSRMQNKDLIIQQKEEQLEQLNCANESLKNELNLQIDKHIKLEEEFFEKNSETVNKEQDLIDKLMEEVTFFKKSFEDERRKNEKLTEDIHKKGQEIAKSLKENDEKKIKLLEENYKEDIKRILIDKEQITKQYEARTTHLSYQIELEKEKYNSLEKNLSTDERMMKKRSDALAKQLEHLNLMYHQITTQQVQLKADKQLLEKKIGRITEKNNESEKVINDQSQKIIALEQENLRLNEEINSFRVGRMTIGPGAFNGKIIKVIKGGNDNMIFKTPASKKNKTSEDTYKSVASEMNNRPNFQ